MIQQFTPLSISAQAVLTIAHLPTMKRKRVERPLEALTPLHSSVPIEVRAHHGICQGRAYLIYYCEDHEGGPESALLTANEWLEIKRQEDFPWGFRHDLLLHRKIGLLAYWKGTHHPAIFTGAECSTCRARLQAVVKQNYWAKRWLQTPGNISFGSTTFPPAEHSKQARMDAPANNTAGARAIPLLKTAITECLPPSDYCLMKTAGPAGGKLIQDAKKIHRWNTEKSYRCLVGLLANFTQIRTRTFYTLLGLSIQRHPSYTGGRYRCRRSCLFITSRKALAWRTEWEALLLEFWF
jgi:hypothetical protein